MNDSGAIMESASRPGLERRLVEIDGALGRGDIDEAHALVESLLRDDAGGPERERDDDLEASALLRFAYCDLARSRIHGAYRASSQAARLFRHRTTTAAEIDSLALRSRTATLLGRGVEAVETALLATELAGELAGGLCTARAQVALGVAYGWLQAYEQADRAFQDALSVAERHGGERARCEVMLEALWIQAARRRSDFRVGVASSESIGAFALTAVDRAALIERLGLAISQSAAMQSVSLSPLSPLVSQASSSHLSQLQLQLSRSIMPGLSSTTPTSVMAVCGLLAVWSGELEEAKSLLIQCTDLLAKVGPAGWLLAALAWLTSEVALHENQLDAAAMHASRMTAWAKEADHLPLALVGHRLAAEIYRRQHLFDLALIEMDSHVELQRKVQMLNNEGRAESVRTQLVLRGQENHIDVLAAQAEQYERWAHEDHLTGIANIRRFNQCLVEWTAAAEDAGRPLCVALIDVDHFKQFNQISYNVGNDVLRGIAVEMRSHVRPDDLAARWGGDEFAILFRETDLDGARHVAQRIQAAVANRDWSGVSQGLRVSISVGVTQARRDDTARSLVKRSEEIMVVEKQAYHQGLDDGQAGPDDLLPAAMFRRMVGWLKTAERVVVIVGSGTQDEDTRAIDATAPGAARPDSDSRFISAASRQADPGAFQAYWRDWRIAHRHRQPTELHRALVALSHELPQVSFVTERIDGLLAMAGAGNVIELYGNAFRDRFGPCEHSDAVFVHDNADHYCTTCGHPASGTRPDITLLGEYADTRITAGAELAVKQAQLVLVIDCNANIFPGASMLDKGRVRGARIVMFGASPHTNRRAANLLLPKLSASQVRQLAQAVADDTFDVDSTGSSLTDAGFDALQFLTGQGSDNMGVTRDDALAARDSDIATHLGTLPWLFPLPTISRSNPGAPSPTAADFKALAAEPEVREVMRAAFRMMLRFYGFQWQAGRVVNAAHWRLGFSNWAIKPSPHDQYISRILGAMTLCGLRDEAQAFLRALEAEVGRYRGETAARPLWHWRSAVAVKR